MNKKLKKSEVDQLTEVINMGAGNASTALSQLMGKKVKVNVPKITIDRVEKITDMVGDNKRIVTMVLLKILGDVTGAFFLLFTPESANSIIKVIGSKYNGDNDKDFKNSILREVGNILSGASLTALSKFLNLSIIESIPETVTDMLGSMLESIVAEIGQSSEEVLIFKVSILIEEKEVEGNLYYIFDPEATTKILKAIRSI